VSAEGLADAGLDVVVQVLGAVDPRNVLARPVTGSVRRQAR
jgi:hypothetical protein